MQLISTGAYCPRDFMGPQHVDPNEAGTIYSIVKSLVQMHLDLRSKTSIGIHWGTFVLTSEPEDEPPKLLRQALQNKNLPGTAFLVTKIGETHCWNGEDVNVPID